MKLTERKLRDIIREEISRINEVGELDVAKEDIGYRPGEKIPERELYVGKEVTIDTGARATLRPEYVEAVKKAIKNKGSGNVPPYPSHSGTGSSRQNMTVKSKEPGNYVVEVTNTLPTDYKPTDKQTFRGPLDEVAENVAAWSMTKGVLSSRYASIENSQYKSLN